MTNEEVIDKESGLVVRDTGNGVQGDDPKQVEVDENGVPLSWEGGLG